MGDTLREPGATLPISARGRLRQILVARLSLEELRTVCFDLDLGEVIADNDKGVFVRNLIDYLEKHEGGVGRLLARICELWPDMGTIEAIREMASGRSKRQAITYFIATSAGEDMFPARFGDFDADFERVKDYREADYIIFDLSKPPVEWLRYVFLKKEGAWPAFNRVIFVEFDGIATLDGVSISDILVRSYGQDPAPSKGSIELATAFKRIRANHWLQTQQEAEQARQAHRTIAEFTIAGMTQPAHR